MIRRIIAAALLASALVLTGAPALAHTYSATAYADITEPEPGLFRTVLDLEYVLLATDGAREMGDTAFEQDAYADVQATGQDPSKLTPAMLEQYTDTVAGYVLPRWQISTQAPGASVCANTLAAPYEIVLRENVPHARITIDSDCRSEDAGSTASLNIRTKLFPGTGPGGQTTTIVTYDLLASSGVANLDTDKNPTLTTTQDWGSRMGEFFVLGAEHLLFGIDHVLFLLALIVGSRRLRDIVLAATAFTVAHSITFVCAALGLVTVPGPIVEPIIALSIAFVALWYLWGVFRRRAATTSLAAAPEPSGVAPRTSGAVAVLERPAVVTATPTAHLTRADWLRVVVVFAFGLVHGLGFAGALGIDEPFSWGLLGALLVFNLGIEAVQVGIILVVFPLLALLRRRIPRAGLWVGIVVSAGVALVGLVWFFERIFLGG